MLQVNAADDFLNYPRHELAFADVALLHCKEAVDLSFDTTEDDAGSRWLALSD